MPSPKRTWLGSASPGQGAAAGRRQAMRRDAQGPLVHGLRGLVIYFCFESGTGVIEQMMEGGLIMHAFLLGCVLALFTFLETVLHGNSSGLKEEGGSGNLIVPLFQGRFCPIFQNNPFFLSFFKAQILFPSTLC